MADEPPSTPGAPELRYQPARQPNGCLRSAVVRTAVVVLGVVVAIAVFLMLLR